MRPWRGFHCAILHYWCGDTLSCCQGQLFEDINGLCHQTLHCWGHRTLRELVLLIWWLLDGHARVIFGLIVVRDYVTLDLVYFGRCWGCYAIFRHIRHVLPCTFWRMYLCWVILGLMWWQVYMRSSFGLDQWFYWMQKGLVRVVIIHDYGGRTCCWKRCWDRHMRQYRDLLTS